MRIRPCRSARRWWRLAARMLEVVGRGCDVGVGDDDDACLGRECDGSVPGAAISPPMSRPTGRPTSAVSCASVTPPSRSTTGSRPVTSTIVDSTPTRAAPPSSTTSTSAPRSARTCAAVVGLTLPNRLADGAATTPAECIEQREAQSDGRDTRIPTVGRPPVASSATRPACLRTTSVSGPGQNDCASVRDIWNISARDRRVVRRARRAR